MSGNGSDEFTLTFKRGDALALARALMLAGNTAMMSGHYKAEERLREYADKFLDLAPAAAAHFHGTSWCEMAMALEGAKDFQVELRPGSDRSWWQEGYIYITVETADGERRKWRSKDFRHPRGGGDTEAVYEAVRELAPMGIAGSYDAAEPPSFMKAMK